MSVCNALTFESRNLQSALLMCRYIFRICMLAAYVKVIGSRSILREQKSCLYITVHHIFRLFCVRLYANCLKNISLKNWILYTQTVCLVKLFKFFVCCIIITFCISTMYWWIKMIISRSRVVGLRLKGNRVYSGSSKKHYLSVQLSVATCH